MTEIQRAKREVSVRFWKKAIMDCKASGLPVKAFCQEHDLSVHAYYYWQRQIREELLHEQAEPAVPAEDKQNASRPKQAARTPHTSAHKDIVPLSDALPMDQMVAAASIPAVAPSITIHYGGLDVDIRDGTPQELLNIVMSVIREEAVLC